MPNQVLPRGFAANLGAGVVPGNITLNGVGANYSVVIAGGAAIVGVAAVGVPVVLGVHGMPVTVTNTSPPPGPPNLTIVW